MAKQYLPYTPGEPLNTDFGQNTWTGDALQGVFNQPWAWPIDTSQFINEAGGVPLSHGTSEAVDKFADVRGSKFPPTMDDVWNFIKRPSQGLVNPGVYTSPIKNVAEKYLRSATDPLKGMVSGLGDKAARLYSGIADPKLINWSRNMLGDIQSRITGPYANKIFGLGENVTDTLGKVATPVGDFFRRSMPIANVGLGATSALDRFNKGQYFRSGLDVGSMVPGRIGLASLAGVTGLDFLINKRNKYQQEQEDEADRMALSKAMALKGGAAGSSPFVNTISPNVNQNVNQGGVNQGGNQGGGGQAAGQRASAVSRPSGNAGYSNVRRYGRAQGGLASLWQR